MPTIPPAQNPQIAALSVMVTEIRDAICGRLDGSPGLLSRMDTAERRLDSVETRAPRSAATTTSGRWVALIPERWRWPLLLAMIAGGSLGGPALVSEATRSTPADIAAAIIDAQIRDATGGALSLPSPPPALGSGEGSGD